MVSEETTDAQLALLARQTEVLALIEQIHCLGATLAFDGARQFFAAPLPQVHTLILERCLLSTGWANTLSNNLLPAIKTFHCLHSPGADEQVWRVWAFCVWWMQLTMLRIHCTDFDDKRLSMLTSNFALFSMTTLEIQSSVITDTGAHYIEQTPLNPKLKSFTFDSPLLTQQGFKNLLGNARLPEDVRSEFSLKANRTPSQDERFGDLRAILRKDLEEDHHRAALLHFLHELDMQDPRYFQEVAVPYIQSLRHIKWPRFFDIEYATRSDLSYVSDVLDFVRLGLDICDSEADKVDWIDLSNNAHLQQIGRIDAWEQVICLEDAQALAQSKYLINLIQFSSMHGMDEETMMALLSSPNFHQLQYLDLMPMGWTARIMQTFLNTPTPQCIEWFNVYIKIPVDGSRFGEDSGIHMLIEATCPNLSVLILSGADLRDETLYALSNASWFGGLTMLDIKSQDLRPELMIHLLEHGADTLTLCIPKEMKHIQTSPYLEAQYKKGRISFESAQMLDDEFWY